MNAAKQFTWLFFILIFLAFSGWYFNHATPKIRLDNETLANSVDITMTRVTVRQFNEEGVLANLLSAPQIQHIQKDNIYLLENPHIIVSQEKQQPPWDIRSQKGTSIGGSRITFTGNVVVHQNKGDNSQESTLKTEEVTYFPKEKKAVSELLVTFEQSGNVVQSTGMNAYLEEKRVELLHRARGSYVPTKG